MFAIGNPTADECTRTVSRRRDDARLRAICVQERLAQRRTQMCGRRTTGDWQAAGCSSSAQWLAQIPQQRLPHRNAYHAHERSRCAAFLRSMRARHGCADARPGGGRHRVRDTCDAMQSWPRVASGSRRCDRPVARAIAPPKVADDRGAVRRRALSMSWTRGGRELVFGGRLPLEQGAAFEQAIWRSPWPQRAIDKQPGCRPGLARVRRRCLVVLRQDEAVPTAARDAARPP